MLQRYDDTKQVVAHLATLPTPRLLALAAGQKHLDRGQSSEAWNRDVHKETRGRPRRTQPDTFAVATRHAGLGQGLILSDSPPFSVGLPSTPVIITTASCFLRASCLRFH